MKYFRLYLLLTTVLFGSCSSEDDFIELSSYDDYMIELTVYFDSNTTENYEFDTEYYKTNGYDELLIDYVSYGGSMPHNHHSTFYRVVKEYKKVGVKITPIANIKAYSLRISAISGYPDGLTVVNINDITDEVTIIYDFETNELSID